ncbi:MAG: tannase/feruloyl esterase family alpha/beta hydrolase, partial [Acidobacteria bacterium]|nr:tannase/feruloyl esterase family alpha/beta hydrolase [Acidobacteriota bacterium]
MSNSLITRITLAVLLALVTSAGGHLVAQNNSQFRSWKPGALAGALQVKPREACQALVALTGYEFAVISATVLPATADTPGFCRVWGQIPPEIRFEVDLPAVWNGRLYMFGNGGYAGEALDGRGRVANAQRGLARGFVVAQTNTGHDAATEPLGSFAASPQKLIDYAFRAVHVTALTAKRLAQAYYGTAPRRSY